jgi:iron(III) transport system ATP-binding protein
MQPFVRIRSVTKRFGPRLVVDDVSLDIDEGGGVALIGPSGSGKTTLLRIVAGLETPDTGEVWLGGQCVSRGREMLVAPHRRGVGFVFQDLALWPHMRAHEHLDFVLTSQRVGRTSRAARCRDALALTRIEGMADRYPHQLSGGEQQRLALARAIVASPRLLLLDEPLSSLDPELRAAMREELVRVRVALGVTVLHVTHDAAEADHVGDRTVMMRNGRLDV